MLRVPYICLEDQQSANKDRLFRHSKQQNQTHAVADFCNPQSCTGIPLNRMNPLPSSTSLLIVPKNFSSVGKGNKS